MHLKASPWSSPLLRLLSSLSSTRRRLSSFSSFLFLSLNNIPSYSERSFILQAFHIFYPRSKTTLLSQYSYSPSILGSKYIFRTISRRIFSQQRPQFPISITDSQTLSFDHLEFRYLPFSISPLLLLGTLSST